MKGLHPAVQVTILVCITLVILGFFAAVLIEEGAL